MTEESELEHASREVDELLELFGPAPVLRSESLQAYQEIMRRFLQVFMPLNLIKQMFIKELTDRTWEVARYTRHKTLLMQRRLLPRLEFQEQRRTDAAQREEVFDKSLAGLNREAPTCPDDLLDGVVEEIDAILLASDGGEVNHLRALEVAFVYDERLDRLLASAKARRNNVLDRIERYQGKIGQHLRRVSNQAIQDAISAASKLQQE